MRKNRRLPKNQLSIAAFNQSRRELLVLFRKGARAKSLVSTGRTLFEILWFYGCNKSDEGFKETLSCAKAVLDYGDPNQRNFSNKTADESIANALAMTKLAPHFLSFDYMKHRLELLALLKSAPEIEPRIIVHPYFEKEEWGKIIRYGNLLIINNHAKAISINNITVRLNSTLDLLTSDGKVFSVKTRFASVKFNKPLFDIDKAEDKKLKERLCFIFRKSFPHVSEDVDFAGILERALAVKTGTVYLDLLCLGTEVYGFSIAEVVDKNPDGTPIMLDGQPIIIHHLRLAATILKYPQIMSYLMHPRGFALLYHELKKPMEN
ncbi:MAG: hypothetical protein HWD59_12795 [Coxiellaceae bacterium]|nr:MAG: hypothetical protein HWD59_12795 [Coxiellaceae bacterium]